MQIPVAFAKSWPDLDQIESELGAACKRSCDEGSISIRRHQERFLETAILVAVITGGASVVSALIQAIAVTASKRQAGKIKITGRFGGEIEIPTDADRETIEALTSNLTSLQDPKIQVE